MGRYVLPIVIEANSKIEAEEKLSKLLEVAAKYKQFTWNDVMGGLVDALKEFEQYQRHKNQQLQRRPKA